MTERDSLPTWQVLADYSRRLRLMNAEQLEEAFSARFDTDGEPRSRYSRELDRMVNAEYNRRDQLPR